MSPRTIQLAGLIALTLNCASVAADVDRATLENNIISITVQENRVVRQASGVVIQADLYNGYVLTTDLSLENAETLSVVVPMTGAQLIGQIVHTDVSRGLALLKVNGLQLQPMRFSQSSPKPGDAVWSAARSEGRVVLSRGNLRSAYGEAGSEGGISLAHSAILGEGSVSSILLNDCGEMIGLSAPTVRIGSIQQAIPTDSIRRFLSNHGVNLLSSEKACISLVRQAKNKAEQATRAAKSAQQEAELAQQFAKQLQAQLEASAVRNMSLIAEASKAQETAGNAVIAANQAQLHAEQTRLVLEERNSLMAAETEARLLGLQQNYKAAEERFRSALKEQQVTAQERENLLVAGASAILLIVVSLFVGLRLWQPVRGSSQAETQTENSLSRRRRQVEEDERPLPLAPVESSDSLSPTYTFRGRDDEGRRYVLNIPVEEFRSGREIVIGRSSRDSPYAIENIDVSRRHALLRLTKDRLFIEDLGSTNGTSVNGRSIDGKGPVSISSGDQIILGSVVMKFGLS